MCGLNPAERRQKMKTNKLLLITAAGLLAVASSLALAAGSAEKGKAAFVKNGCWQCHGFAGQGSINGLKLAPEPKPLEFYAVFVRHSNGPMPPYSEKILSKQDLEDIHAYLQSIPKGADYKSIPQLQW
jgi:ubiquinol-cytochrome c reductase cytochrome c subunit